MGVTLCRQLGAEELSPPRSGYGSHELPQDDDPSFQEWLPGGF